MPPSNNTFKEKERYGALDDNHSRIPFTEVQKQAIGIALSEIRHQLRQEIKELGRRLTELEARVGWPNESNDAA